MSSAGEVAAAIVDLPSATAGVTSGLKPAGLRYGTVVSIQSTTLTITYMGSAAQTPRHHLPPLDVYPQGRRHGRDHRCRRRPPRHRCDDSGEPHSQRWASERIRRLCGAADPGHQVRCHVVVGRQRVARQRAGAPASAHLSEQRNERAEWRYLRMGWAGVSYNPAGMTINTGVTPTITIPVSGYWRIVYVTQWNSGNSTTIDNTLSINSTIVRCVTLASLTDDLCPGGQCLYHCWHKPHTAVDK